MRTEDEKTRLSAIVLTPDAPNHMSFDAHMLPMCVEHTGLSRNETLSNLASSICDRMTIVIQLPRTKSTSMKLASRLWDFSKIAHVLLEF